MENKDGKTLGKNTKTKRQLARHLGRYIERRYAESREQLEHLLELVAVADNNTTDTLDSVKERIKGN